MIEESKIYAENVGSIPSQDLWKDCWDLPGDCTDYACEGSDLTDDSDYQKMI